MAAAAPLFLGTAATGTAAATTGLIGTAGAFSFGTALTTLGTAATIGGLVMGARGAQVENQATQAAASYNIAQTRELARVEEARQRRDAQRQLGRIRSGIAKSGATSEGTPLMVLAESAANAEIDALNTRWSAENQINREALRARAAERESFYRTGTSLLTGAGRLLS